ncbi:MAG: alpha/beta hydrolase [Paramuribaculum sp.]|nr:alpha/beta hydrolase [Paramuribaculum sp.]
MKLVFHIAAEDSAIVMDSPDQGVKGIVMEPVGFWSDSINCRSTRLMMSYAGKLKDGVIEGTFFQRGFKIPLILHKGEKKVNRPQTTVPPFPYNQESVIISNDSVSLAGTLTVPEQVDGSVPVVVLVSGSGLQSRDEELFEHKPFAVMADYLARNGIASLRYDDRGFGESKGDVINATTADFAADARMVMEWLKSSGRFGKTGIIGHSEGGQIAYMLGAEANPPDFIISVAGPSVKGSRTIAFQNKNALLKSGIDTITANNFEVAIEKAFNYKLTHQKDTLITDSLIASLYPQYNQNTFTAHLSDMLKNMLVSETSSPWMTYFLGYDPCDDMKNLKIPVFIIYGEKDKQVPPYLNLEPARKYVPGAKTVSYPGLNHLMQHAVTGEVEEYSSIEETISPDVLADITTFINTLK